MCCEEFLGPGHDAGPGNDCVALGQHSGSDIVSIYPNDWSGSPRDPGARSPMLELGGPSFPVIHGSWGQQPHKRQLNKTLVA